ncbi:NAD-P-binding protein [Russula earlei]|uniref:NAD-P-binding protein n=1 Tax=Russula earlei TaxID=71964 RepID=A0ACC0TXU6_9AGAM|nr:NAD-P-binding protein [Russula earlei]
MASLYGFVRRVYLVFNPPAPKALSESPLRFGILGAAKIAPLGIVWPVKNHPDAVVEAVAARDQGRADAFAKRHGIPKAYGGPEAYQRLLDDPEIDVVYNPLPVAFHYEWTMKALAAGKHVLLEKPSSCTAEETRKMFALAQSKGLTLMEAFHNRFYPAILRVKEIVDSGELGTPTKIEATFAIPGGLIKDNDIQMIYHLGGGVMMDMGCYPVAMSRYLAGTEPTKIISARADVHPKSPQVDLGTTATLAFPNPTGSLGPADGLTATLVAHARLPKLWGFLPQLPKTFVRVIGTRGTVELSNFLVPWLHHTITVESSEEVGGPLRKRTEKQYGNLGYRYQLEAFIDKLRGRNPENWIDAQDSIANLEWVEAIYKETGLGSRPASTAEVPQTTTG